MKKCLSIFLIVSLGINLLSQFSLLIKYELNKDYIAKNLCINKSKPAMKCNGKCHLSAQLKKNEENENKTPQGIKEIKLISLYFQNRQAEITYNFIEITKHFTRHLPKNYLPYLPSIDLPPIFFV